MSSSPFHPITDFDGNLTSLDPEALFQRLTHHDEAGVYSIALANIRDVLIESGYRPEAPEVWSGSHLHVYVGETYSLKHRLQDHFAGDHRLSSVRKTLMALTGMSESAVTSFLWQNALVSFGYFPYIGDVERFLIQNTACPFNLSGKGSDQFAVKLRRLRKGTCQIARTKNQP